MPLTAGTRLGPYEIITPLGAGGMGEVYRARDSRLNRDVAIKILPSAFSDDSNRVSRFQREAQVLAALNHPNIAAIYGLEESGSALVMELVDGPTLAERIAHGAIPVEESLEIARQIADALEAAHEKGIVHRDLKPANIKITPDGNVKVLDFGLAKAFDAEVSASDPANSPTLTLDSTRAGVILGTAGYMSPEQARGKTVDKRADIWSFGVVLYEMLTGRRTFEGETMSDTLAAVLKTDPDWSRLPSESPPQLRRLLQRCIERDPRRRLRDIGDVWIDMDAPVASTIVAAPGRESNWKRTAPWIAAALVTGAAAGWFSRPTPSPAPRTVTRWSVSLPTFFGFPSLTTDGTRLAYTEVSDRVPHITLRTMDQLVAKPIPGTEGGLTPVFSPDGEWVAYTSQDNKLLKNRIGGGAPIVLGDGGTFDGADWGRDGTIVFGTRNGGLMRIPAEGGAPEVLTRLDAGAGETAHRFPQFLPGGRALIYTIGTGPSYDTARIAVLDLSQNKSHVLVNGGYNGRYVPTGHMVYVRGQALAAVPFDPKRLAVTGSERVVVQGVRTYIATGRAEYSFSDTGLLVYMSSESGTYRSGLEWRDRMGVATPTGAAPREWANLSLSPDSKRVAGAIRGRSGTGDIWVHDISRGTFLRLTFDGAGGNPVWTPDGRRLAYTATVSGKQSIYWVAADGNGKPEVLATFDGGAALSSWTPEGKALVVRSSAHRNLWILPVAATGGTGKPFPWHDTSGPENSGVVSPDGKWMAYASDESGKMQVYVQPFPGPGAKVPVSTEGGGRPRWSRDGRELFFASEGPVRQLMAVNVQTAPLFRASQPKALFTINQGGWDVAPDGKRFLVEKVPEASEGSKLEVVTDWFEELKKRQ